MNEQTVVTLAVLALIVIVLIAFVVFVLPHVASAMTLAGGLVR